MTNFNPSASRNSLVASLQQQLAECRRRLSAQTATCESLRERVRHQRKRLRQATRIVRDQNDDLNIAIAHVNQQEREIGRLREQVARLHEQAAGQERAAALVRELRAAAGVVG